MGQTQHKGDRIWQMYDGEFGTIGQRQARERIHWICEQCKPNKVLDLGCSQVICDILLSREGFQVVGIDLDKAAIDYACARLLNEEAFTQERVKFLHMNFMDYEAEGDGFDTVILSEVLEHLLQPGQALQKAAQLLKEDGKLIVSVPFGINDWPDHKRTYYVSELLKQVESYFSIEEIKFFSQWIACVARVSGGKVKTTIDLEFLTKVETAFYDLERPLRDQIKSLMQKVQEGEKRERVLRETFEETERLLQDSKRDSASKEMQLQERDIQIQNISKELADVSQTKEKRESEISKLLQENNNLRDDVISQKKCASQLEASWHEKAANLHQEIIAGQEKLEETKKAYNTMKKAYVEVRDNRQRWIDEYNVLAESKLGRIQKRIWSRQKPKSGGNRYRVPFRIRLKEFLKKIPFLVPIVHFLRGDRKRERLVYAPSKTKAQTIVKTTVSSTPEKQRPYDMDYYERIKSMVEQIPQSNGSRYYGKLDCKIGWITDVILYDAFKSVADGVLLTPDNWEKEIQNFNLLFIISGWHGIKNEWNGFACEGSPKRLVMYNIIQECQAREIPTVFYSVEDPPNFDHFIGIAQKVDYVFTAAVEMLPKYREMCGHDRIYQLSYGIDPLLHNPVGFRKFPKQKEVFFAGSWMEKYSERGQDLRILFDGIIHSGKGLKIVDRNLLLPQEEYRFPEEYSRYISPPLDHGVLQKVHKLYNWAININSVKESATMFANRTYELQAMGNLMLSNYSVGVNSMLPLIFTSQHSDEVQAILNGFTDEEVYERQVAGIRFAMRGNTCFERVAEILERTGRTQELPRYEVAVVVKEKTSRMEEMVNFQSYPYITLLTEEELKNQYDQYDIVAFFDENAEYGCFYLEDMVNGFKYTDCDYITKAGYYSGNNYIAGVEHDYVSVMQSKTRTVFWRKSYAVETLLEMDDFCNLANGYSIDRFQYNAASVKVKEVPPSEPYMLSVIVPVYNNGLHLYGKAFNSLRRSSIFDKMEILLIDDGSTESYTTCIVRSLASRYPNVKTYFFGDGGSGSASRPRNKGVEMATADYITFLDPDNEAVNDAYAHMLQLAIEEGDDIVVGNMSRFRLKEELANYHYYFMKYYKDEYVIGNKKDFLSKIRFTPMSIQAMVIKKSLITESGISQVVGAVGQDSFFSWQLFANAGKIHSIETVAHIYYAMVQNSTVNTISSKYFERSLLQERVQKDWLVETGLFDKYMKVRFVPFFRDWYLKKLEQAREGEEDTCAELLWQIFELYQRGYQGNDIAINSFAEKMCQKVGKKIDE